MKKHGFTLFIVLASLLMCGAAWLVRNRLSAAGPARTSAEAYLPALWETPAPTPGGPEPVWDEALGQWSLGN